MFGTTVNPFPQSAIGAGQNGLGDNGYPLSAYAITSRLSTAFNDIA